MVKMLKALAGLFLGLAFVVLTIAKRTLLVWEAALFFGVRVKAVSVSLDLLIISFLTWLVVRVLHGIGDYPMPAESFGQILPLVAKWMLVGSLAISIAFANAAYPGLKRLKKV